MLDTDAERRAAKSRLQRAQIYRLNVVMTEMEHGGYAQFVEFQKTHPEKKPDRATAFRTQLAEKDSEGEEHSD